MKVYVLGAGFSAAAGLPTTKKLFMQIRNEKIDKELNDLAIYGEQFEEFLSKIDLELFYIKKSSNFMGRSNKLKNLRQSLLMGLTHTIKSIKEQKLDLYSKFADRLNRNQDAVISFNYDLLLEKILESKKINYDYYYQKPNLEPTLPLLKLHGSINHFHCDDCDNIVVLSIEKLEIIQDSHLCPRCNNVMDRAIIPPTLLKKYAGTAVEEVWPKALELLQQAEKLCFIGYKIPEADLLSYQLFLFSFLTRRHNDQEIEIVLGPEEKSYLSFRNLYGRRGGKIEERHKYFEEWID